MQSLLWKKTNDMYSLDDLTSWDTFKRSDFFFKIALWHPNTNGVRYLKMLLYNLGMELDKDQFNILSKITNRDVGNPISVSINDHCIDFDYLSSVYEIGVMKNNLSKDSYRNILEIGAGYGRTCHSILTNFEVESYTILDLDLMLNISKKYLKEVLSEEYYSKIKFISVDDFDWSGRFTLAIQIDGFNEMDSDVAYNYLEYIAKHCTAFYTKNPIGKYMDKELDNHWLGDDFVNLAESSGVLTDLVDIHDNIDIKNKDNIFVNTFMPDGSWKNIYSGWSKPTTFMWDAIYMVDGEKDE